MRVIPAILALAVVVAGCSSDSGSTTTCTITAVAITGAPATLNVGSTATLTANLTQQNCSSPTVTWSSSNNAVLSVSQSGVITAVTAGGPVTITASAGGQSGTASVTVAVAPVASTTVAPDSIVVGAGQTFQLAATTRASDNSVLTGRTIAWSSSAGLTASVSASGLVSAVAPGSATITATSETKSGTGKVFVATPRLIFFWSTTVTPVGVINPSGTYNYSLGAGVNSINSSGTGGYTVSYTNFARTGAETEAMFVSAYGVPSGGSFCDIGGWNPNAANVYCYNAAGVSTDMRFDFLSLASGTFPGRYAYAWMDNPTPTGTVAPAAAYRFSSSNQAITETRSATGVYTVVFAGLGRTVASDRETVLVTAYAQTGVVCQSSGWSTVGSDLSVTVYCFTAAGVATDAQFDIGVISKPRAGANVAYVDADQPSSTSAYTPTNGAVLPTGTATVTRSGAGAYTVRFDGLIRSGTLVESFQVSPIGTTAARCSIGSWGFDATGVSVSVSCFNTAGTATDTRFALLGVQ